MTKMERGCVCVTKMVCERWRVNEGVTKMVCKRWCVTKMACERECDKEVCERCCVTMLCVCDKDVVFDKDGV